MKTIVFILLNILITLPITSQSNTMKERKVLLKKIFEITETQICNPSFLETQEWNEFSTHMYSDNVLGLDDYSFTQEFNKAASNLTFTHYYIQSISSEPRAQESSKRISSKKVEAFELTELNENSAVLTVRRFIPNGQLMKKLIDKIQEKAYENLVIDLRGNGGGTLDAAVVLGQYLTSDMIDAGSYLSRSWFKSHKRYPTEEEIKKLPFLTDMSYAGFQRAAQEDGFRMVIPPHTNPIFEGQIFILTDAETASTCEPLVHLLKQQGVGTIIGQPTAGAMLSGRSFKLNDKMNLFLPVQDYVTAEGYRLDKVGVTPDIEIKSEQALDKVLSLIE